MKAIRAIILLLLVIMTTTAFAAAVGDYRVRSAVTTGNWNGTGVWQICTVAGDPGTWANTTTPPTSTNGVVTIQTGKTITVSAGVTVDQVVSLGNLKVSSGVTLTVANGAGTDLSVSGTLTVDGTVSTSGTVVMNGFSTVVFNATSTIIGSGTFTLSTDATLKTKNPDGITSSGSAGSVQTTTRIFGTGSNYYYNAADGVQIAGTGLPSNVNDLYIENPYGVTLSNNVTVSNVLGFASSGTIYLSNYDLTMDTGSSTSGFVSIEYNGTGLLVDLAIVDFLEVYITNPVSIPLIIGELLVQTDVVVPNNFEMTTFNGNGYHIDLNNKTVSFTGSDIAFTGTSEIHVIGVSLSNTSNTYDSGTSIARTWTTYADYMNGALDLTFTYPESETNAAMVKVWRRPTGDTGSWILLGTYSTTGTDPRSVTITGITDLGDDVTNMDWTISDVSETLPVELSSFTATPITNGFVRMDWVTQSETGVQGFYIYRNTIENVASALMVSPLISATNTSQETSYSFIDRELPGDGTYYYWLQNQDINGNYEFHGPIQINVQNNNNDTPDIPMGTKLNAPYPNPFNPELTVAFDMAKAEQVQITIYNTKGQLIRTLLDAAKNPGNYRITWDGKTDNGVSVTTGLYYVKMVSDSYKSTQKVMMMK